MTKGHTFLNRFRKALSSRASRSRLRVLGSFSPELCDFSSNDYLGLVHSPPPSQEKNSSLLLQGELAAVNGPLSGVAHYGSGLGSTGSRILTGNSPMHAEIESFIESLHPLGPAPPPGTGSVPPRKSALLFNSGYSANLSLMSSVPGVEDVCVLDSHCHNSTFMGLKLSACPNPPLTFRHNDLQDLEDTLFRACQSLGRDGGVVLCIEGYYSMTGTLCPLSEMVSVSSRVSEETGKTVSIIIDEAHSGGIFGCCGRGRAGDVVEERGKANILAVVMAFGKAYGGHGGAVVDYSGWSGDGAPAEKDWEAGDGAR